MEIDYKKVDRQIQEYIDWCLKKKNNSLLLLTLDLNRAEKRLFIQAIAILRPHHRTWTSYLEDYKTSW